MAHDVSFVIQVKRQASLLIHFKNSDLTHCWMTPKTEQLKYIIAVFRVLIYVLS